MTNLRKANDEQQEAQRFSASEAAREVTELDVVSVLIAIQVKISEGRIEEARAIAAQYRKETSR